MVCIFQGTTSEPPRLPSVRAVALAEGFRGYLVSGRRWCDPGRPVERVHGAGGVVDGMANAEHAADRARADPWSIRPARLELIEVTARDIQWLDRQIQLPTRMKPNSSYLLHLLRVHGKSGRVEGGEPSSGEAILKLFTDERAGASYFGQSPLVRTASGVRFPTQEKPPIDDRSLEQHRDQTLAAFGELGLPLSHPLNLGDRPASLRDVLRDSIANFHPRQEEIAWTAMAYALYLPPIRAWVNRYGERFTFDDLADELHAGRWIRRVAAGFTSFTR